MTNPPKRVVVHPQAPAPARRLVNVVASAMRRPPSQARRHILGGYVGVNQNITRKPDRILNPGDTVDVFPEEEKIKVAKVKSVPFPKKLHVLYEDSQLLVVDKPAGLLSVPTKKGDRKTMLSLVELYLQEEDPHAEVYSLQRLDRDVSGVMLFAKDEPTYLKLREQFEANKPSRKYVAIIAGQLKTDTGTFRTYLATGKDLKRYSVKNEKEGELAITHYKVIRRLPKETIVEVTLETGRRNQIRVHFAEAGHPVIGETRYSRLKAVRTGWDASRIALHANTLGITHPVTNTKMEFCSPWPQSFKDFLKDHTQPATDDKKSTDANTIANTIAKPPNGSAKRQIDEAHTKNKPRDHARRDKRNKSKSKEMVAVPSESDTPVAAIVKPQTLQPRIENKPNIPEAVKVEPVKHPKPKLESARPVTAKPEPIKEATNAPPEKPSSEKTEPPKAPTVAFEKPRAAKPEPAKVASVPTEKPKTENTRPDTVATEGERPQPPTSKSAPANPDPNDVWGAARLRREQKRPGHGSNH